MEHPLIGITSMIERIAACAAGRSACHLGASSSTFTDVEEFRITIWGVEKIICKSVTEQHIEDWADEAERGYDVNRLRKRGRKPIGDGPAQVVPVRIDETLLPALTERADHDQVSRSEAIRAAIRAYVA